MKMESHIPYSNPEWRCPFKIGLQTSTGHRSVSERTLLSKLKVVCLYAPVLPNHLEGVLLSQGLLSTLQQTGVPDLNSYMLKIGPIKWLAWRLILPSSHVGAHVKGRVSLRALLRRPFSGLTHVFWNDAYTL